MLLISSVAVEDRSICRLDLAMWHLLKLTGIVKIFMMDEVKVLIAGIVVLECVKVFFFYI